MVADSAVHSAWNCEMECLSLDLVIFLDLSWVNSLPMVSRIQSPKRVNWKPLVRMVITMPVPMSSVSAGTPQTTLLTALLMLVIQLMNDSMWFPPLMKIGCLRTRPGVKKRMHRTNRVHSHAISKKRKSEPDARTRGRGQHFSVLLPERFQREARCCTFGTAVMLRLLRNAIRAQSQRNCLRYLRVLLLRRPLRGLFLRTSNGQYSIW